MGRPIGSGMKARGNERVKRQNAPENGATQPTEKGQETGPILPDLASQEGNKTPVPLSEEKLQNLESEPEGFLSQEAAADLQKVLAESGDSQAENLPTAEDMERAIADGIVVSVDHPSDLRIAELEQAMDEGRRIEIKLNGDVEIGLKVGIQPDGSKVYAIAVQEAYWPAVEEWAQADGLPVEQWLSDRLYEYVSSYGQAPRGR